MRKKKRCKKSRTDSMKKKRKENVKQKNASYDNDLKKERNIKRKIT